MSLSIALVFSRLGLILWSARLPNITWRDLTIYLSFLLLTSTQLQIALETKMMGAPIGGLIGVQLSQVLTPLGPYGAQSLVCIGIFGVLGLQMWLSQKQSALEGPPPEEWISEVHRGAQPVKSLNELQQRAHSHVFDNLLELPPEFENESSRFEAVESFYDDLDGAQNAELAKTDQEAHAEPFFSLALDGSTPAAEPRLTMDNSLKASSPTPTYARERSIDLSRAHSGQASNDPLELSSPKLTALNTPLGQSTPRTPIERLSQTLSPKVSRETLLQRAFDSLQLTFALTETNTGRVADRFEFVSPVPPAIPLYEIAEQLNAKIRRSLGRSEPPLLLTLIHDKERYIIEATWPRRDRAFVETSEAMKVIREIESRGELSLYLGDNVTNERALLSFSEVRSMMITGGEGLDQDRGLDLVITNLIYQSPPSKLRLLILDIASERSSYTQLPHLYSPIVDGSEKMTEVLKWLPIEYRRRRSLMGRAGVHDYDTFMSSDPNSEPRIVIIISELSHLDNDQHKLLISMIEKIAQSEFEVGIHIIANSRVFGERCAKFIRHVDAHIAFAVDSLEEARGFGISGAEWLLPTNDLLLSLSNGSVSRIHSWTLPKTSYKKILGVLARSTPQEYINPNREFLSLEALKSNQSRSRQHTPTGQSGEKSRSRAANSSSVIRRGDRLSESSMPPV